MMEAHGGLDIFLNAKPNFIFLAHTVLYYNTVKKNVFWLDIQYVTL